MLFLVAELLIDGTIYSIKSTCRYLYNWYYSVDEKGDIWVLPPDTALDKNGVVGMGRYVEL